jgi:hypothetical protein
LGTGGFPPDPDSAADAEQPTPAVYPRLSRRSLLAGGASPSDAGNRRRDEVPARVPSRDSPLGLHGRRAPPGPARPARRHRHHRHALAVQRQQDGAGLRCAARPTEEPSIKVITLDLNKMLAAVTNDVHVPIDAFQGLMCTAPAPELGEASWSHLRALRRAVFAERGRRKAER